ncbi:hypothetical protein J6590_062645 [Homalodisca vitripennis]|nr:hypothetical protein J6590_062645 [Homalodisca vitripennis]
MLQIGRSEEDVISTSSLARHDVTCQLPSLVTQCSRSHGTNRRHLPRRLVRAVQEVATARRTMAVVVIRTIWPLDTNHISRDSCPLQRAPTCLLFAQIRRAED